ncbi:hypothetical protein L917_02113 [Phytophthora nicotianae]|uniref:Retrotransposon gag domain-containing protein n=1 Tax=Phytophthora nicotianae TaxID=4792 RepID=W2LV47_PHYNI|nr:hypothetical protein L917_02113 [Phytophthora nicotianae]
MAMMRQMFEFMSTAQRQNQEQMEQMLQQQTGNPPQFNGKADDDLEFWLFSTEQYYSNYSEEMQSNTSDFVNTIFGNLGPAAQTWYREFKIALGDEPATWAIFNQRIRERFSETDFQHKALAFVSRNVPTTLKEVIDLARRFQDSRTTSGAATKNNSNGEKPQGKSQPPKKTPAVTGNANLAPTSTGKNGDKPTCAYCDKSGHTEAVGVKKNADTKVAASKNT